MSDTETERITALEGHVALLAIALEQLQNPTPLAAVPPITIGELTDVPAPGSPIAAQWAQEISNRVIQRFATKAALDGWAAANGSMAVVTGGGTGTPYLRTAGQWLKLPLVTWFQMSSDMAIGTGTTNSPINVNTPAFISGSLVKVTFVISVTQPVASAYDLTFKMGAQSVMHQGGGVSQTKTFVALMASSGAAIPLQITINNWGTQITTARQNGTIVIVENLPT